MTTWFEVLLGAWLSTDPWDLDVRGLPSDVMTLADPMDPLAQSRLWGAIYAEIPTGYLVEVCIVESGCREAIGVHDGDAHKGPSVWAGVWARRKVDRSCPYYVAPGAADAAWLEGASTRGNHGLMSGYHIPLLGDCVPLDALDIPFFSAWAAAEKSRRVCAALKSKRKRCTREYLRCAWAQAPLGSSQCGRVIKRFRKSLAKHRKANPNLDPRKRFTLQYFRRHPHFAPRSLDDAHQ
jgi:hypothetical protein